MKYTRWFSEISKADAHVAGGKGASLGEMTQAGIPVPPGFVVLAHTFEAFLSVADLTEDVEAILAMVDHNAMHTVEHASEKIQALITSASMPQEIADEIQADFKTLDYEFVAVRSSATAEDGASHAWAGQLNTYLNTTEDSLIEHVQKCWASLFTPRAIFYRFEKGLHTTHISVAVVIQKMVQSEVSGIAFSVHPVTEDRNQMIIESGFGLGEAIVSGQVTPDSFVVSKEPLVIIETNIATQNKALVRGESGNVWQELTQQEGGKPTLQESQVLELATLVKKIETHYGTPQDIEWAFEAGTFFVTQSRPITTLSNTQNVLPKEVVLSNLYQKMFQWDGPLQYIVNSLFVEMYAPKKVVTFYDGTYWKSYMPKTSIGECAQEGAKLYASKEWYASLVKGLEDTYNKSCNLIDASMVKGIVLKEDISEVYECIHNFFLWYSYTEFYFTDGAYAKRNEYSAIEENFATFEHVKLNGRKNINTLLLGPNSILKSWLCTIAAQYSIDASDILLYSWNELIQVPEGSRLDKEEIHKRRAAYFAVGDEVSVEYTSGEEAKELAKHFTETIPKDFLRGKTASKGKVSGRAYVITLTTDAIESMSEVIERMEIGDILVADTTAPEIIAACNKAGGIITNQGGMMSHAAIVSRELGIPCLVGTETATMAIKTGDIITLDADDGEVILAAEKLIESNKGNQKYIHHYSQTDISVSAVNLILCDRAYGLVEYVHLFEGDEVRGYVTQAGADAAAQIGMDLIDEEKSNDILLQGERAIETLRSYECLPITDENVVTEWNRLQDVWLKMWEVYRYTDEPFGRDLKREIEKELSGEEIVVAFEKKLFPKHASQKIVHIVHMLHALGEQRLKLHAEAENLINQEQVFYDYIKNKCGYKDRHVRMLMQEEVMRAFAGLCVSESLLDDRREGSVMFRNENAVYVIETGGVYTKFKNEIEKSLPKQIKGVIAYKGKVTGKVVRHLSWSGTKHIDPGSILVTGMTNPQMIPLIRNAGAIVTDEGGLTCHAAIIAREMKIPCIVGTQIATQILRDGDQIVVDAHQGIVEKI